MNTTRIASLAAALMLGAAGAHAQSLATFGSAEVAGFGEGSALIGTALSTGHQGWGPTATLVAQTYRYRLAGGHAQAYALSPSVGMQYVMPDGSIGASVGYTFVNTEFPNAISGAEFGGKSGPFVSAQYQYWGNGERSAQLLGSYGFESEYYWTRGRVAQRMVEGAHPIYLGLEAILQGTSSDTRTPAGVLITPSQTRYALGPTIEYRVSNDFRVGASGGVRGGNNNTAMSGYARVEFLLLSKF